MSIQRGILKSALLVAAGNSLAQEALRELPSISATNYPGAAQAIEGYTVKYGDFRLLVQPVLEMDWNDNVRTANTDREEDFIIQPLLQLSASYPLAKDNELTLSIGAGYNFYASHRELSNWLLQSGSGLTFRATVKDYHITLHSQFSFVQDSGQEAAIANTGSYGAFSDDTGFLVERDLNQLVLDLGYSHEISESTSGSFEQDNLNSDSLGSRVGMHVLSGLAFGGEATGSFVSYDQKLLNNSTSYSLGGYGAWDAGQSFHLQARAGFGAYFFDQTSAVVPAENLSSWYASLTATHHITRALSYSFSAGREERLGIDTDFIRDWYVRPTVNWAILKNTDLALNCAFEHGDQSQAALPGTSFGGEIYDYFSVGMTAACQITKQLGLALVSRFIVRSSNITSNQYEQDLIGLRLSYRFL